MMEAPLDALIAFLVVAGAAAGGDGLPRRGSLPFESVAGLEIRYGDVTTAKGYRVRTITSRPRGVAGRLPLVVFIPWLSCDRVESPHDHPGDGWGRMLN